MLQFGTSAFNMVVRWHKLGEVENEYTEEKPVYSGIVVPKIFTIGLNLTKFWQKISLFFLSFLFHQVYYSHSGTSSPQIQIQLRSDLSS